MEDFLPKIIAVLILVFLLLIAIEDFRYRNVHLVWFVLLFSTIIIFSVFYKSIDAVIFNSIFNISFLLLQWALVTIYFSIKNGKLIMINDRYIGWGDWVFFISVSPLFSFSNFIIFYVLSLLLVLMFSVFQKNKKEKKIPLAGGVAIVKIMLFLITGFKPELYFNELGLLISMADEF